VPSRHFAASSGRGIVFGRHAGFLSGTQHALVFIEAGTYYAPMCAVRRAAVVGASFGSPFASRFPVVTRTLRFCAEIHNNLIERASCDVESPLEEDVDGGSGEVHLQGDCDLDETRCNRNRASEKCPLRVAMTRELNLGGMRRPA